MNVRFQSALNRIKAGEALINRTEIYLRDNLAGNQEPKNIKFPRYRLALMKNLAKIACIVYILVLGGIGKYTYYKSPVSYLSIDINPSIEFGVNVFDRVVSVEGYNADGKTVLTGINMVGANITTAVSTVISSAVNNGFIDNDGSTVISLTSVTDSLNKAYILKSKAETGVKEALEEKGKTAVIFKDYVALGFRDEARKLNMTPGKLNLIKKLQTINPSVTVEQYRDAKIKDIMNEIEIYNDNNMVYSKEEAVADNEEKATVDSKEKDAVSNRKAAINIKEDFVSIKGAAVNSEGNDALSSKVAAANSKDKDTLGGKEVTRNNKDKDVSGSKEVAVSGKDDVSGIKEVAENNKVKDFLSSKEVDISSKEKDIAGNKVKEVVTSKDEEIVTGKEKAVIRSKEKDTLISGNKDAQNSKVEKATGNKHENVAVNNKKVF